MSIFKSLNAFEIERILHRYLYLVCSTFSIESQSVSGFVLFRITNCQIKHSFAAILKDHDPNSIKEYDILR